MLEPTSRQRLKNKPFLGMASTALLKARCCVQFFKLAAAVAAQSATQLSWCTELVLQRLHSAPAAKDGNSGSGVAAPPAQSTTGTLSPADAGHHVLLAALLAQVTTRLHLQVHGIAIWLAILPRCALSS